MTYTINNPITGDDRDFETLAEARRFAKKQNYTPVFIDLREDGPDSDLSDKSYRVENPGKQEL